MLFIEQVKQSEELVFVRDDVLDTIASDEINEFKNIISILNPIKNPILNLILNPIWNSILYPEVNNLLNPKINPKLNP